MKQAINEQIIEKKKEKRKIGNKACRLHEEKKDVTTKKI